MKLKLASIKVDGDLQSRDEINEAVVQEYAEVIREGGKMPPITAFYDGAKYHVADGWHRYFAHKAENLPDIEATIIEGTRRDAILFSLSANDDHGLRRTNADKRKAVMVLLEDFEWSEWNDTEIARTCKVSSVFVNKLRKQTKGDDAVPEVRKVKRGDTEYTMNTKNMGREAEPDVPEYDEKEEKLEELATEFKAIAEENEDLKAKLAVGLMEGTPEEKKKAQEIIEEQAERIKALEAQVKGLTASRDSYQLKNGELIKQVNYWKKQAQK
jgi:ParB-like chromosome segregation protein Spo0J